MFAAAYYGLFRAGEIAQGLHIILANNVHIGTNKNKLFFFSHFQDSHHRLKATNGQNFTKTTSPRER